MRGAYLSLLSLFIPLNVLLAQSVFPIRGDGGEARNRSYDVLHYTLDVNFDVAARSITGKVTTTLVPFFPALDSIEFDAEKLQIHRVTTGEGNPLDFDVRPKSLLIHLDKKYSYRDTLSIVTEYSASPKKGLYFVTPDSAYPHKTPQFWTQGEDMDNHFWFPCYDFPNDKATSELIGTVPSSYTLVSNGRLIDVRENRKTGTRTYHWKQSKPHVSYLIMVAAGEYALLKDRAGTVPLEYYVLPGQEQDARVCFQETPAMIQFFNKVTGFNYPWEKYAQILCTDFIEGGMENTSATTLMDEITVYDARTRLAESPVSLIAHELSHQWWGDVITCKDWRHLWLNESFASYFDPLYREYSMGHDEFSYTMYENQQAGIQSDKQAGRKPIVSVGSFGANIYPRGSAVLHMLRFVLGDTLFWKALHHYITKFQFQSVETSDFKNAVEEATGQNLYWFFDQWVYKAGYPVFDVAYAWNDSLQQLLLAVHQTQTMDSLTGVFRTPVNIEIGTPENSSVHRLNILTKDTVFTIPCQSQPRYVLFDSGNWLLKDVRFSRTREEWKYLARHAKSPVDRILAIDHFKELSDSIDVVSLEAELAQRDGFWAVRRAATEALGHLPPADSSLLAIARDALLTASRDSMAVVRAAAMTAMGAYHDAHSIDRLRAGLNDASYSVIASALSSLSRADSAHARDLLVRYLDYPSIRNSVANAALSGLARVDSAAAVRAAYDRARYGNHPWTRITALYILGRYAKAEPQFLSLLLSLVNDKSGFVASTALRQLGNSDDPRAAAVLEEIAKDPENAHFTVAQESLEKVKERKTKSTLKG